MYEVFEKLLNEAGITAYKFCKETGVSSSTISTWKKKGSLCGTELAGIIANYFGETIDYVLTGKRELDKTRESGSLSKIYFSLAKEAEESGIDPGDIRLALDTIKKLRGGN